jgi:hypothetical protein
MVKFDYLPDGRIAGLRDVLTSFNEPSGLIPAEVTALTGITAEMVAGHKIDEAAVSSFMADTVTKELGNARTMANILAAQSVEMRGNGEAMIKQADKLLCESWNERMWSDGEPTDPSPTIDQAINGGFPWLEIQCARCKTPNDVDLAALNPRVESVLEESCHLLSVGMTRGNLPNSAMCSHQKSIFDCRDDWIGVKVSAGKGATSVVAEDEETFGRRSIGIHR